MKDEEMAEEYANKNKTRGGSSSFGDITNYHDLREGFLAGLKAGRPQWHKADVPTSQIHKVVLGYVKHYNSKQFCLVGWNGIWWYDAGTYNDEVKLIAWCELPAPPKEIE